MQSTCMLVSTLCKGLALYEEDSLTHTASPSREVYTRLENMCLGRMCMCPRPGRSNFPAQLCLHCPALANRRTLAARQRCTRRPSSCLSAGAPASWVGVGIPALQSCRGPQAACLLGTLFVVLVVVASPALQEALQLRRSVPAGPLLCAADPAASAPAASLFKYASGVIADNARAGRARRRLLRPAKVIS